MFLSFMVLEGAHSRPKRSKDKYLESLIMEIAKGNTGALAEFYKATDSSIYGFALSILKRPHEAEDVMHDAYLKIYEAADTYQSLGKPMAWILTIVRNLALSRFRLKDESNLPLEDDRIMSDSYDFTESTIDRIILDMALGILTDEECQVVVLHSITGLKHREIAEILGLPLSTVISKYHRSLLKLRKKIKEEI